ncbi:MAG TPA: ribosome maturation factor RimM [Actinomycetota bacterium]|jgi:16S rRNA processing protein RimM|nr:ribosome maturation factor RimM [Actinomycetota bacterium]
MSEPTVAVGRIGKAHGVRGEVVVVVLSEVPERFDRGSVLRTEDGRSLTVASSRPYRDKLLVTFEGVGDRVQAEALQTALLVAPESSSPSLPEGSWWDHQIEGCSVATDSGLSLGTVREVIHTAANDVWSAVDEAEVETLIPVLGDVLVEVDIEGRRIVVREIPGLTAPEEPG